MAGFWKCLDQSIDVVIFGKLLSVARGRGEQETMAVNMVLVVQAGDDSERKRMSVSDSPQRTASIDGKIQIVKETEMFEITSVFKHA